MVIVMNEQWQISYCTNFTDVLYHRSILALIFDVSYNVSVYYLYYYNTALQSRVAVTA